MERRNVSCLPMHDSCVILSAPKIQVPVLVLTPALAMARAVRHPLGCLPDQRKRRKGYAAPADRSGSAHPNSRCDARLFDTMLALSLHGLYFRSSSVLYPTEQQNASYFWATDTSICMGPVDESAFLVILFPNLHDIMLPSPEAEARGVAWPFDAVWVKVN